MQMIDVQSSNVAAIGYDPDTLVLAVRYRDGALYVWPNFRQWQALQDAPSKGKFLAALKQPAIKVLKGGAVGRDENPEQRAASNCESGPLYVIDEDASPCCRKQLAVFFERSAPHPFAFDCSECGLRYVPQEVGPHVYWRIAPAVAIVRR